MPVAVGSVVRWDDDEGWGVLASPEVPSEIWAHFSAIEQESGYRSLDAGEAVEFDYEHVPHGQDGFLFSASRVARIAR